MYIIEVLSLNTWLGGLSKEIVRLTMLTGLSLNSADSELLQSRPNYIIHALLRNGSAARTIHYRLPMLLKVIHYLLT